MVNEMKYARAVATCSFDIVAVGIDIDDTIPLLGMTGRTEVVGQLLSTVFLALSTFFDGTLREVATSSQHT